MDSPQIIVQSFGFLHEVPAAPIGALLVDLRTALRNPHDDPQMRYRTGRDDAVRQHVLETQGAFEVIARTTRQALALFEVNDKQFQMARVLVGCQGGRHRSVVVADMVGEALAARGIRTEVEHLHINRPVVQR
jgi:RNase adaptor protein for sRNA GlmZ degradation